MAAQLEQQPPAAAAASPSQSPPAPSISGDASPASDSAQPQAQDQEHGNATPPGDSSPPPPPPRDHQPQGDVDSALLSALRDSRERRALLKLERVLVGFMRERTTGYIEVGGQYNSIVIGGGAKVAGAAGAAATGGGGSGGGAKTVVQPQGAGRQTTFQRLCLHRLADRFGIVREAASTVLEYEGESGGTTGGGAGGMGAGFQPTLIRLVKTKDSKIPPKLLIDLEPSAYSAGGDGRDDDAAKKITRELSSSRLSDTSDKGGGGGKTPISSGGPKARKMVIMKRSSSKFGTGSSDSLRGDGSGGKGKRKPNKIKGKNLSDKEKAYAEARARILGEHADNDGEDESAERRAPHEGRRNSGEAAGGNSAVQSPSGSPPPPGTESTSQPSPPNVDAGDGGEFVPQEQPKREKEKREKEGRSRHRDGNRSSYKRDSANSKVTWRNRRQEETDPDFRRGGSMVLNAPAVGVQGPLHAQQPAVIHYGAPGPVAMGYAYANGAAMAAPIMVAASPMGHHPVGVHAQQQQRGVGGVASPVSADGKGYYQQQAAAHRQQYYYQGGVPAASGHGQQPPAQAQAFVPQQRGAYQYQQQQQQSRGYFTQAPTPAATQEQQQNTGTYASARPAVADVHSMDEFPSLGGGGSVSSGSGSGGEKK